jgi:hypothetical protein
VAGSAARARRQRSPSPGAPGGKDCAEGLNGTLRDELLNAELFNTLAKAEVLIEQWRLRALG